MANGSGAAIAGLIIGIVIATQVGAVEGADLDANSAPDETVDSTGDDDDSTAEDDDSTAEDDDSTPQAVPTQVNGGLPGDEPAGPPTDLYSGLHALPWDFGLEPTYTPDVLDILDRPGDPTKFCAASAPTSCCQMPATGPTRWLRLTC